MNNKSEKYTNKSKTKLRQIQKPILKKSQMQT